MENAPIPVIDDSRITSGNGISSEVSYLSRLPFIASSIGVLRTGTHGL